MSNFGFFDLRLVNAYRVAVDEARSAVGAAPLVAAAREFSSVPEAVADSTLVVGTTSAGRREVHQPLRRLEYGARLIRRNAGPVAILFGSEKFGLSNDDLSYCHWLMRIPSREEHASMNLGQAVAVCLYELIRDPRAAARKPLPKKLAPQEAVGRLEDLLVEALNESGYLKAPTSASMVQKVRRLLRRNQLTETDAELWQGMLRQILWRMRR